VVLLWRARRRAMARLELRLLGGFAARVLPAGRSLTVRRRKAQALLAYLALHPGRRHLRDQLTTLLWGELDEDRARNNLRVTLFALRQTLARARVAGLHVDGDSVALEPGVLEVDVLALRQRVAVGTVPSLAEAAHLYHGELLEGFRLEVPGFEEWLVAEREQLRATVLAALRTVAAEQAASGETESALATTLKLLSIDSLDESAHRRVMRLHADSGRPVLALRQYQACVALLRRELDVAPSVETRELYRQILARQGPRPPDRGQGLEERPGAPGMELSDLPLIGRAGEMSRLRKPLSEALRGRSRIVLITGEAGGGKTRLVSELMAEARRRNLLVVCGRGYESERILAYGPWLDAIRNGGLLTRNPAAMQLEAVWHAELARLFPELGDPPPLVVGGDVHARLFEATTTLVGRVAALEPVLLVLEDLHWADDLSTGLLSFLGRRLRSSRLLIVVTAREEELDAAEGLRRALHELDRAVGVDHVSVPALTEEDTNALTRALAGRRASDPAFGRISSEIWHTCRGNPFMVVETWSLLQEQSGGEAPDPIPLPPRVREVIERRLGRLSEQARELATLLAVLGRASAFAVVQRAARLEALEAAHVVEELVRRRVIHAVDSELDFTHDRIREAVYEAIPRLRRRLLHAEVAAALEQCYAKDLEPHLLTIARHYREAEAWDKAVTALRAAGRAAASRGRLVEARTCMDDAIVGLDHLGDTPQTLALAVDLRFDLRNTLFPLGEMARLHDRLLEAEKLAAQLGDAQRLGYSLDYLGNHLFVTGSPRAGEEFGERARAIAQTLHDVRLRVAVSYHLGAIYVNVGEPAKAETALGAVAEWTAGNLRGDLCGMAVLPSAAARSIVSYSLADRGRFREARAKAQEGVDLAVEFGHDYTLTQALLAVGYVCNQQGEHGLAVEALESAVGLAREKNFPYVLPVLEGQLGYAYVRTGREEEGLTVLARAETAATAMHVRGFEVTALVNHVRALVVTERWNEAEIRGLETLAIVRTSGQRVAEAWILFLLGEIWASPARLDVSKAREHYAATLAMAGACGLAPLAAHCERGLGELARREGRTAEAASRLDAAARSFREMGMRFS